MNPRLVSVPYERRPSAIFGALTRPVVYVELYSAAFQEWIACTMVVDTGADYCVLPSRVALHLGIKRNHCERQTASGIGGQQTVWLCRAVRLRLGPWELHVPMGIVERDDLPPLLGRSHCLDVFDLRLCRFVTTFSPFPEHQTH